MTINAEPLQYVLDGNMTLKPIVHEIRIQNQVIFLDPPIEYARDTWFKQLHEWLGVVCRLRRIQSSRYEIGLQMEEGATADLTYTFLVGVFFSLVIYLDHCYSSRTSRMASSSVLLGSSRARSSSSQTMYSSGYNSNHFGTSKPNTCSTALATPWRIGSSS